MHVMGVWGIYYFFSKIKLIFLFYTKSLKSPSLLERNGVYFCKFKLNRFLWVFRFAKFYWNTRNTKCFGVQFPKSKLVKINKPKHIKSFLDLWLDMGWTHLEYFIYFFFEIAKFYQAKSKAQEVPSLDKQTEKDTNSSTRRTSLLTTTKEATQAPKNKKPPRGLLTPTAGK
jgi:hypothetical protein